MIKWYVMQSKPQKEHFLYSQLRLSQIETYLPLVNVEKQNGSSTKKPFFPRYLFIQLDLSKSGTACLQWMPGAKGIVSFGGQPASIPDYFIYQLKNKLETMRVTHKTRSLQISKGSVVKIIHGPFEGYDAIFNQYLPEKDRVNLFLKALSDNTFSIEIPASHITV